MSKFKTSRVERQTRNLCRGLFWIGMLLLAVTVFMTGKFGYDSGTSFENKLLAATGNGAIDAVGALLMMGGGVCFAWRWRLAGVLVMGGVIVCMTVTAVGIFGFLASNRIAVSKASAKAEQVDRDQLEWLRNQTVTKGVTTSSRDTFLGEIKGQIRELKSAGITAPDAQSTELAAMTGLEPDAVNRALTAVASGAILFSQFACLWLYGFLGNRVDLATGSLLATSGAATGNFGAISRQLSIDESRSDVKALLAAGVVLESGKVAAERWGVSAGTACKRLKKFKREGLIERVSDGATKAITAPARAAPHLNGNGRATA